MKLLFLGTSHGIPGVGRFCQSILVEAGERMYLFDAGAPAFALLINRGYDLKRLSAIFISHPHSDHTSELPQMLNMTAWAGCFKTLTYDVYLPDAQTVEEIKAAVHTLDCGRHSIPDRTPLHAICDGLIYDDGNLRVTAIETAHMPAALERKSYAFLIEHDGVRVCITGDLQHSIADFPMPDVTGELDALVTECAHFEPEALIEKLQQARTARAMVIHISATDRKIPQLQELADQLDFPLLLPNDGDEFEI